MKHAAETNLEFASYMSPNQSIQNYFPNSLMSKNKIAVVLNNHNKLHFVVDWQMENDKQ